jgi:hypothetical protein
MENRQTAVEYLVKEFSAILGPIKTEPMQDLLLVDAIKQAKQMEKEQKQEFYNEGKDFSSYTHDEQYGGVEYWDREPLGFEDYYNEQYGKS